MSHEPIQNYENHRTMDNSLYVITLVLLLGALLSVAGALLHMESLFAVSTLSIVFATVGIMFRMRAYATTVQDRVIRLEMRLRLERVLTGDLAGKANELTKPQLIGLRFASDAELPDLVRKVLAEHIAKADDIKKLVKDWQADHWRV